MSITYVDTDVLQQLQDRMGLILSHTEECGGALRQMYSQMQGEDGSFYIYPQWSSALDRCGSALQKMDRLTETAERLLRVLEGAPGCYQEMEQKHIRAISRLTAGVSYLGAGMAGVMAEGYPLGLKEGEKASAAADLEQETAMAVQSLELTNLMALSRVLQEEYSYDHVVPASTQEEEEEVKKKKAGSASWKSDPEEDSEEEDREDLSV